MTKQMKKYITKSAGLILIACLFSVTFSQAQTAIPDSTKNQQSLRTIAYGEQPEWEVTGSISSIKGDDLTKSFATNVANTLYARIPGLTVGQTSGEAGNDAPTLNSRGVSTFGSGRDICVIIDGFPSTYDMFQQLTAQEIESINLLKDASAAVIYGNKAANGVLLIKTKRGSETPLKLNFNVQYGLSQPTRLPEFLDSYNYAKLYNEARVNDYGPGAEVYSATDLELYKNGTDPHGHPNVNWYNELLKDVTPMSNYNLSATGGSETVKYFVLLNVANNQGLFKGTEDYSNNSKNASYMRYNFRTNVDIKLATRLSTEITLGGNVEDRVNPGRGRNNIGGEYSTNVFNLMAKLPPNAFPVRYADKSYGGNSVYYNPLAEITETGYYSTNRRTAQISAKLIGDLGMITPGLSISGAVGFNTDYKSYYIKSRNYARVDMNGQAWGENTSMTIDEKNYNQWRNLVFQGFLNYDRLFNEKHHVNAMLMTGYEEASVSSTDLPFKDIASGGRFTYSFDKRYIGEFSFAYSGTDNFAPGNRFGFFPAGSLGWVASNEEFLRNNETINYLKLRGSYGLTGNKETGSSRFPYNQYYTGANYYLGESNSATYYYYQSYYADKNATWEKDKKLNIGIEATLLNKVDVSFDYFKENRYDILAMPYNIYPSFSGFKRPQMNVGEVKNNGFEAVVRFNDKVKDVTYFVEASAWYASNEITFNAEEPKLYPYQYLTGNRIDQPFLLESLGFFNDQNEIANSPSQVFAVTQPGDIKYKNQNDDNVIDQNDLVPVGYTPLPEYTLGLHGGAKYKGFDIDFLFHGVFNRSVYFSGSYFEAFQNDGQISTLALGRWTEDTKSSATYPRLSSENNMNNYQQSSFWQKNGNFLKLRSLEIGYTLPDDISRKIKMSQARVFLNGTNLFSIDHMDGFTDPETLTGFPSMRTISLGVNIQL